MAGGYARTTGKIGACIATAGPGATNLVTGIANAYADAQPVIAITGEAPTYLFGKGGLQESSGEGAAIDQSALFDGITRYHKLIERTDYLISVLNKAAKILRSDKPGPVVLSIPFNLQNEEIDENLLNQLSIRIIDSEKPLQNTPIAQNPQNPQIEQVVKLLGTAKSPILIVGYGCILADAQQPIRDFSERYNIPVASSLKAKGVVDEWSPLSLGSLGVTSNGYAREYIQQQADLVIFLGASFNERTSYVWQQKLLQGKKMIQVDIDPLQLEKTFSTDLSIQGDIRQMMNDLLIFCDAQNVPEFQCELSEKPSENAIFDVQFDLVKYFFHQLEQNFGTNGQNIQKQSLKIFDDNIVFAQNFFSVSNGNHYYPNSGVSSLGHAIPAVIGAGFDPQNQHALFAIVGDGGFQMCCMEIMTAVNYEIPLTIVLFNNQTMGLIRKNQHQHYDGRLIGCDFINPDFKKLSDSFGIEYCKLNSEAEIEDLLAQTDFSQGIRLIEIPIAQDAYPNYSSNR